MDMLDTIDPQRRDLGGGFLVRRLLPSARRQAVGPFLFFDHFGPLAAGADDDHDVRPHPHIGLATVTYLFEGAMVHRDSTGAVQRIEPGAVNWMTAGRGIVHSQRAPDDLRGCVHRGHGLQLWCALPAEHEETAPSFVHTPAEAIPQDEVGGVAVRVLIGSAFGCSSSVAPQRTVVLPQGATPRLATTDDARLVLIGGTPLGHRFMAWNFVSSSRERIRAAEDDWEAQRFPPVPGETEFIPLPPRRGAA